MAHIAEFIWTEMHKGRGTEADPHRLCPQLWTKDGKLIGQYDPCDPKSTWFDPSSEYPPQWSIPEPIKPVTP